MDHTEIGKLLQKLRKEKDLTQCQVGQELGVSAQAISKWERGLGCPDISMLPQLSRIYGVSIGQLLEGDLHTAPKESGNMKRVKFYVCPDCGNIMTSAGDGELHCCGRRLEPLTAKMADLEHLVRTTEIEEDWYITFDHPMRKDHFFRFAAYVTLDRILLVRLYPEQGGEFRIPQIRGGGQLDVYCSNHGLMKQLMK